MNQQGVLHCEICNAELPNFNSMKWHIGGKRHKNALEFWAKRKEQATLSIFVRGFPIGTTEQELWQYFAQFGRVTKVSLVKPKNMYSIVEFSTPETVQYVIDTRNHRLNSQTLTVRRREVEVPGQPASNKYEHGYNQFRQSGDLGMPPVRGGPMGRDGPMGGPMGRDGPMGGPMGRDGPMGGPMGRDGPMGGPMGSPMGRDGPMGGPMGRDGPMGGPMGRDGPMGGPMGRDGPMGGPMGRDGPMGRGGPMGGPMGRDGPMGRGGHMGGPMGRGGRGGGMLAYGRSGYREDEGPPDQGRFQNEMWFDDPYMQEGPGPGPGSNVRGKKKGAQNVEEQIEMYYHEELIEKLLRVKGVQNQLEWLCQNLQVTAEEAQTKFTLCEKLQTCLGQFFPGCTVNQFGSSVNGFGLTGCDMDIFLDLTTMHSRTWEVTPIKLPFVRDFKFLKEKEWGPLLPKDIERMGMGDECKLISRILTDHLEGILDVQVIPSNRCPIVRFKYTGSDVKCDLSVNNKLALQNTKLLYLFSVLNSRVRLLVYAIRYWGKIKGVAGNSQATTKLSNYALTLMVLNYLQNLDPPVLPTIEKLSLLHGPTNRSKIEGWDVTFAMDWQVIPQSNNTQTAAELLSGFFSYWSAFNFHENVLITRTATELPFTLFFEKEQMSDGRIRSFKASAVNVQDPFVLSHNITQNVNEKMRDTLVRELRIAAIKTSVWGNEGFSMMNPSGGGDLVHLLNNEVPDIIKAEDQEKHDDILERGRMPARKCGDFEFEVVLKPQLLTSKILKQLQKGPNFREEWCKKMCVFITRVLKEVLMLTIEELPEASEEIKIKLEEEQKKKEEADKRNEEIRKRRDAKRAEKRKILEKEYEEKINKMKEEMEKKDEILKKEENEAEEMEEDQQAEAGEGDALAGEKRPRPVNIFDLEMQIPKRFKHKKEFQFNLDSYVELSDDDEEIIEYEPDEPQLHYKKETEAAVSFQNFMRAFCMTWARRKKVKNYLVNEEGRMDDGIAMEKLISEAIWQNDRAPLRKPVVGFYCQMDSILTGSDTKLIVKMECREGERDFNTFFQFTKMYLYKMIDKYFN